MFYLQLFGRIMSSFSEPHPPFSVLANLIETLINDHSERVKT